MAQQIQLRSDTTSNWEYHNPTLAVGEIGIDTTTGEFKIGDGDSTWSELDYFSNGELTLPASIKDVDGNDLLVFEKGGTGVARIHAVQDDLALRSARDIILYPGDDGPGHVYINWGDATITPDSPNRVATMGDILSQTVPTAIKDSDGDDLITFERTGTGTARIGTPQDDLSLRSARDITLIAGDDGPGNVYIGWGDATITPNASNRVATIGDIENAPKTYTANNDAEYGTYQANGFTELTTSVLSTATDEVGAAADYFNTGQIEVFISLSTATDALLTSIQNASVHLRQIKITDGNSTENFLTNPVRLSADQSNARWRFDCSPALSIANNTGYGLFIEYGGAPIVWWDAATLDVANSADFRGAKIDYHAYASDAGAIIGTIYIASDSGDTNVTHIETASGGNDIGTVVLWRRGTIWSDEGKLFLYRTDGESVLHKIQWTAQVYYATESYGD